MGVTIGDMVGWGHRLGQSGEGIASGVIMVGEGRGGRMAYRHTDKMVLLGLHHVMGWKQSSAYGLKVI